MNRITKPAATFGMLVAFVSAPTDAQQSSASELLAAQQAAMAKLAWMDGEWRGLAVTHTPGGDRRVTQTERIGNLLDGTVKLIEGRGFNPDGSTGFNAFGAISYDPETQKFEFRSYAQGHSGTFAMTPTASGYVWEIPAGPMTIRYTATLANGTWTEVGDRVLRGQPPARFFEMHLTRVGNSRWPVAGAMTEK